MLVIVIAIEKYDDPSINDLPGTQIDKQNLIELFEKEYKYKVITHEGNKVTVAKMRKLLEKAKERFKYPTIKDDRCDKWDGIIICYSGHGNGEYLICSDFKTNNTDKSQGIFDRVELQQFFNGIQCPKQVDLLKFYFVDACRGEETPFVIQHRSKSSNIRSICTKKSYEGCHLLSVDKEVFYMHPNPKGYATADTDKGGCLIKAIVDVFGENLESQRSFQQIVYDIQDKGNGLSCPDVGGTMGRIKGEVVFCCNEWSDDEDSDDECNDDKKARHKKSTKNRKKNGIVDRLKILRIRRSMQEIDIEFMVLIAFVVVIIAVMFVNK